MAAAAAVGFAQARGAPGGRGLSEAAAVGREVPWGEMSVGAESAFADAGFRVVSRPGVRRVVMRVEFGVIRIQRRGSAMIEGVCVCGCGEPTKGGRFKPGHDQKLRAAIEHAAGGLESLRAIVEKHLGRSVEVNPDEAPRPSR